MSQEDVVMNCESCNQSFTDPRLLAAHMRRKTCQQWRDMVCYCRHCGVGITPSTRSAHVCVNANLESFSEDPYVEAAELWINQHVEQAGIQNSINIGVVTERLEKIEDRMSGLGSLCDQLDRIEKKLGIQSDADVIVERLSKVESLLSKMLVEGVPTVQLSSQDPTPTPPESHLQQPLQKVSENPVRQRSTPTKKKPKTPAVLSKARDRRNSVKRVGRKVTKRPPDVTLVPKWITDDIKDVGSLDAVLKSRRFVRKEAAKIFGIPEYQSRVIDDFETVKMVYKTYDYSDRRITDEIIPYGFSGVEARIIPKSKPVFSPILAPDVETATKLISNTIESVTEISLYKTLTRLMEGTSLLHIVPIQDVMRLLLQKQYIYHPSKSEPPDDPFSFYEIKEKRSSSWDLQMDRRLANFTGMLQNTVLPETRTYFNRIYTRIFGDTRYVEDFMYEYENMDIELSIVLRNIILLGDFRLLRQEACRVAVEFKLPNKIKANPDKIGDDLVQKQLLEQTDDEGDHIVTIKRLFEDTGDNLDADIEQLIASVRDFTVPN